METASRLIRLRCTPDPPQGSLVVAEGSRDVPFEIRRVFYLYGMGPGSVRARHANRVSKMVLVCVAGRCRIRVDDGRSAAEYELSDPTQALFADRMTWKEMYAFSPDCVLLVLSDSLYDPGEYIRDYGEFREQAAARRSQGRAD